MKALKSILLAALISLPITFIVTFELTPLYWKLEPILGMELAGHSGPSDWVFYVNYVIITIAVFLLVKLFWKTPAAKSSSCDH